jgi:hypothetical protein
MKESLIAKVVDIIGDKDTCQFQCYNSKTKRMELYTVAYTNGIGKVVMIDGKKTN